MKPKLYRFTDGTVAISTGPNIKVLGAELEAVLDASALSPTEQAQLVAHPKAFEVRQHQGKLTSIARRPQEKPSKADPAAT